MPQPERLPGTPEFLIKLPQDGAEARGYLLVPFGGNGTNKFLLREGSLVTAQEWPRPGAYARRVRAELRAEGAPVDVPAAPGAVQDASAVPRARPAGRRTRPPAGG
ncbi:hypothetical protein [Streptomyces sp. B3I8]|uniref:hypothetical protein n=1 Tax=Streptomyces sp. B3I8 TaxID=3042303 RepID=UPI00278B1B99|nr:hypothetical protein [Streptomyces sp. B3I8]MDQ0786670.1 hypothetical protein [Streptomyces sp. B3I8]